MANLKICKKCERYFKENKRKWNCNFCEFIIKDKNGIIITITTDYCTLDSKSEIAYDCIYSLEQLMSKKSC